jgi:hypothetical protein
MHLHKRGLQLWEFLTDELPYPPSPLAPAQSVISEKTTATKKENFMQIIITSIQFISVHNQAFQSFHSAFLQTNKGPYQTSFQIIISLLYVNMRTKWMMTESGHNIYTAKQVAPR